MSKKSRKGKTKSTLSLSERRYRAAELFQKGYTDTDVARELEVTRNTAASYRRRWREEVKQEAAADPSRFRDVLTNTALQLDEIDQVRKVAWEKLHRQPGKLLIECESCEAEMEYQYSFAPSDTAVVGLLNLLTKTAEQRAKLLGLMGVEQRVFVEIQNVNFVQQKMMWWLGEKLDASQRRDLADFIERELADFIGSDGEDGPPSPVFNSEVIDAIVTETPPELSAS